MGDPKAFLNIPRQEAGYRPIHERITDFSQVEQTLNSHDRKLQPRAVWTAAYPSATGHVRWAIKTRNSKTRSTGANGAKPIKY